MQYANHGVNHHNSQHIAKDIDILDSEFAQEESKQIEAYYKSVNKESAEEGRHQSSQGSMHVPRKSSNRSSRRKTTNKKMLSPPAKGYQTIGGHSRSMTEKKLISGVRVGVSRLDHQASGKKSVSRDDITQLDNKSQVSRESQRSVRRINAKAVAQAKEHLQRIQLQRRKQEAMSAIQNRRKEL